MNKTFRSLLFCMLVLMTLSGCANRHLYFASSQELSDLNLYINILLVIEFIIFLVVYSYKTKDFSAVYYFFSVLITIIFTFLICYTIVGEWSFRLSLWALSFGVGKAFYAIVCFFAGLSSLLEILPLAIMNGVFKSVLIAKWMIIPGIAGGAFQIFLLIIGVKFAKSIESE